MLEAHSILTPPVNIYDLIIKINISYKFHPFSKIEGLYINNFSGIHIGINKYHPFSKQRFTAAHEIKHHLLDSSQGGEFFCLTNDDQNIEQKANKFSAELLVPQPMLKHIIKELGDDLFSITSLSEIFLVSYQMMVYRLNSLRIINDSQKYHLLKNRDKDKFSAKSNKKNKRLATIHNPSILLAFNKFKNNQKCSNCKKTYINDINWTMCPGCGYSLNF